MTISNLMKMEKKNLQTGRKHCGKRRNNLLRAISRFPSVLSLDLCCKHVKTRACLFGKELTEHKEEQTQFFFFFLLWKNRSFCIDTNIVPIKLTDTEPDSLVKSMTYNLDASKLESFWFLWVFYWSVVWQHTSEPRLSSDETKEILEYVSFHRDMTWIISKSA